MLWDISTAERCKAGRPAFESAKKKTRLMVQLEVQMYSPVLVQLVQAQICDTRCGVSEKMAMSSEVGPLTETMI